MQEAAAEDYSAAAFLLDDRRSKRVFGSLAALVGRHVYLLMKIEQVS